jgi:hypothetical protein
MRHSVEQSELSLELVGLSYNPNITEKFVYVNQDKDWNWLYLSYHPNITWNFILFTPNLPWNLFNVLYSCNNCNITLDDVLTNFDISDLNSPHREVISYKFELTWRIVRDRTDLHWHWGGLSRNLYNHRTSPNRTKYENLSIEHKKTRQLIPSRAPRVVHDDVRGQLSVNG